jgi:hypothetical protein
MRGINAKPLYVSLRTFHGGQNDRFDPGQISDDQWTVCYNADLGTPGRIDKRPGITMIANDVGTRTMALQAYYPTGASPRLYRVEGANVRKWTGSGDWSSSLGTVTTGLDTDMIQGGESGENEVVFLQNGTEAPQRINSSDSFQDLGTGATSPPKTLLNLFFNNRWWTLLNGFLYYSDAFSSDYSGAFSSANGFRFSGYGDDKGLFSIRSDDSGSTASIIVFMQNGIFGLTPSATPAATDRPFIITSSHGAVERKCICQVGDDVLYLAPDGIRSLKRTYLDHLQIGASYPLSYPLKEEFGNIDWSKSSKFHMIHWQDKVFFFFVQSGGSDINRGWVYWPALDAERAGRSWSVLTGLTLTALERFFISGEERLYGGSTDGKVYRLWSSSNDDDGTAISLQLETKDIDFGAPAQYKFGGELEIICATTSSSQSLTVSALIDGGSYTELGTIDLVSTGPSLPVNLPFNLTDTGRVSEKFHLDSLGRFRRIRFKLVHNSTNTTDTIRILEINATSFPDEYQSED